MIETNPGNRSNQGESYDLPNGYESRADPGRHRAVKILEKYVPGISKNPMVGLAKGMTLKALLAMPQAKEAGITEEMVKKVLAEINARK